MKKFADKCVKQLHENWYECYIRCEREKQSRLMAVGAAIKMKMENAKLNKLQTSTKVIDEKTSVKLAKTQTATGRREMKQAAASNKINILKTQAKAKGTQIFRR